ncbi:MAG: short-chain dehydrogenase [Herpetosiphonaceae bacterium]|nr:MAG: short-chain dehydrogenase [Herpetosiphonaceae bacterium]
MKRRIEGSVVVITGASSGIGRATAHAFARRGANLVLAARSEGPLREAADECGRLGAQTLVVPIDVTNEDAVRELARRAVERFGRIDVWVNDAAVTLFSRFGEEPPEVYRRVIETNLFGSIYGARAALRQFREQGSGVLINLSSVVASISQPYTSAYDITKHGIRALSESLRQELYLEGAKHIHICTVLPATVDTPLFQHGANYTGWAARPIPPVYSPEKVAEEIVDLVKSPQREVFVGGAGRMVSLMRRVAPRTAERMMARQVQRKHFDQQTHIDRTAGNLFDPMPQIDAVTGGWQGRTRSTARRLAPVGVVAVIVGLVSRAWPEISGRLGIGRRQRKTGFRRIIEPVERAIGR